MGVEAVVADLEAGVARASGTGDDDPSAAPPMLGGDGGAVGGACIVASARARRAAISVSLSAVLAGTEERERGRVDFAGVEGRAWRAGGRLRERVTAGIALACRPVPAAALASSAVPYSLFWMRRA